jgi:hypothetical protein
VSWIGTQGGSLSVDLCDSGVQGSGVRGRIRVSVADWIGTLTSIAMYKSYCRVMQMSSSSCSFASFSGLYGFLALAGPPQGLRKPTASEHQAEAPGGVRGNGAAKTSPTSPDPVTGQSRTWRDGPGRHRVCFSSDVALAAIPDASPRRIHPSLSITTST